MFSQDRLQDMIHGPYNRIRDLSSSLAVADLVSFIVGFLRSLHSGISRHSVLQAAWPRASDSGHIWPLADNLMKGAHATIFYTYHMHTKLEYIS